MSEHQGLRFEICLEPRQATTEWLTNLLHRLWKRGLSYSHQPVAEPTWQMELDASSCQASTKEGVVSGSLRQCVDRLIEARGGLLSVFADSLQMTVGLDSYTWEPPADGKWARWLSLSIERVAVDPIFADIAAAEQGAYLRAYSICVHWSAVLCELTQAWYGFGYNPRDGVRDDRGLSTYLLSAHEEIAAGKLPNLRRWLKDDGIQYIAPRMASQDNLTGYLGEPGCRLQRLRNGGLFIVPLMLPFVEEDALAYQHFIRAETAAKTIRDTMAAQAQGQQSGINAPVLQETAELAKARYRRALEIFEEVGDEASAQRTRTHLASLDPLIERLSHASP